MYSDDSDWPLNLHKHLVYNLLWVEWTFLRRSTQESISAVTTISSAPPPAPPAMANTGLSGMGKHEQSGCPPYSIVDVYHTYISCFPISDTTAFAIAGSAGGEGLLLVVTALILSCVLVLRKVHSTQSKLYTRCSCKFIGLSKSSEYILKVPQI